MGTEHVRAALDDAKRICAQSADSHTKVIAETVTIRNLIETIERLAAVTEELLHTCDSYDGRLRRTLLKAPPPLSAEDPSLPAH